MACRAAWRGCCAATCSYRACLRSALDSALQPTCEAVIRTRVAQPIPIRATKMSSLATVGLEDEGLAARCSMLRSDNTSLLRLLQYPALQTSEGEGADAGWWGVSEHTDYELFSVLHQDRAGLQLCRRSGEWITLPRKRAPLDLSQAARLHATLLCRRLCRRRCRHERHPDGHCRRHARAPLCGVLYSHASSRPTYAVS
jgi:hypothetical protein